MENHIHKHKDNPKNIFYSHNFWLGVLLLLCVLAFCWFFIDLHRSFKNGSLRMHHFRTALNGQQNISSAGSIQPWMTFDYINFIFKLPPAFLQTKLNIRDRRYPNLQIAKYAKEENLPSTVLISSIQDAILSRAK